MIVGFAFLPSSILLERFVTLRTAISMEAKLWIDSECDISNRAVTKPGMSIRLDPDDQVAEQPRLGRGLARLGTLY